MAQASVAFRYFDGSGAFDCFTGTFVCPRLLSPVPEMRSFSRAIKHCSEVRRVRYLSREELVGRRVTAKREGAFVWSAIELTCPRSRILSGMDVEEYKELALSNFMRRRSEQRSTF
jgi:hypothetical protein